MARQIILVICTLFILTNSYSNGADDEKIHTEQITINPQMKEQILKSPFKAILKTKKGGRFMAYLFAEDEKRERDEQQSCENGDLRSNVVRVGNYFIYLYDINKKSFLPYKTLILKNHPKMRFNEQGGEIIVLQGSKVNKSDVLLISQSGGCGGDYYVANGFLDDKPYLQTYVFNEQGGIKNYFYGKVKESKAKPELYAYGLYGILHNDLHEFTLLLSDKPREITVKPKYPDQEYLE